MTTERRRSEYLSPNFVLALILALATAQQTWNNFNNGAATEIARMDERLKALRAELDELRRELRRQPD